MANNLPAEKKVTAISMLAERMRIRSAERITGVHRDKIIRLGVRVGEACAEIHDGKMRNIHSSEIEIDEILGFIGNRSVHEIVTFSACTGLSAVPAESRGVIGVARTGEALFCFKPLSGTGQAGGASGQPWAPANPAQGRGDLPEMIRITGIDD